MPVPPATTPSGVYPFPRVVSDIQSRAVVLTPFSRSSLLLANEQILHTSTVLVRPPTSIHLPSFLLPAPKRRQLILTDFPRLITVKEELSPPALNVRSECVFVAKGSARRNGSAGDTRARVEEGTAGWVLDVQEKGPKGFTVQTVCVHDLIIV